MPITSITYTRKFNLGNYEMMEVSAAYTLDSNEKPDDAYQFLKVFVESKRPTKEA